MATKTKAAVGKSVTGLRLNKEKILKELRENRSYRGGSGVQRKALFDVKLPVKVHVLPDMKERGPDKDPLPYLDLSVHWLDRVTKEGKAFPSGVMCVDELAENEPGVYQRFLTDGLIKDERCPACEILSAFDEKEFPKGTFGTPRLAINRKFYFQVLKEEASSRGDDHPIKILAAGHTGKEAFRRLISDDDVPGVKDFEAEGLFTSWDKSGDGKSWLVTALNPKKIWLEGWQKKMLDLELITPVFLSRDEIIQDLVRNLPQFPVPKFFNLEGTPKKTEKAEPKPKLKVVKK